MAAQSTPWSCRAAVPPEAVSMSSQMWHLLRTPRRAHTWRTSCVFQLTRPLVSTLCPAYFS
eukprot:258622-Prorocentrum_lima.AAC.1